MKLIAWLLGPLVPLLQHVAGRVLIALGFGMVTFTGVQVGLNALKAAVIADVQSLPARIVTVASILRVDQAILVIFAAFTAKLAFQAVEGAVSKFVMKAPS